MREPIAVDQIRSFEAELNYSRRGVLTLYCDLERRLLRWKESNHWNRNFTRSINLMERQAIRDFLAGCHFEYWPQESPSFEQGRDFRLRWELSLLWLGPAGEERLSFSGLNELPDYFLQFAEGLSVFCRRPFALAD